MVPNLVPKNNLGASGAELVPKNKLGATGAEFGAEKYWCRIWCRIPARIGAEYGAELVPNYFWGESGAE